MTGVVVCFLTFSNDVKGSPGSERGSIVGKEGRLTIPPKVFEGINAEVSDRGADKDKVAIFRQLSRLHNGPW